MARSDVPPDWVDLPDEKLLDLRLSDLPLKLENTVVEGRIAQLRAELEARDLRFPIHFYISDEWFTPDGTVTMAVPFYLTHPRLERLEKAQMLEVEGGDHEWCMRILRHEAGHVVDNAYKLRLRRQRRALFGSSSEPYPEFYDPKPFSKSFVQHIDPWYAQSHPDEDFAETFAVWLTPESNWQRRALFGSSSEPYPEFYDPKPFSKSFVQHIDPWYAQSHPDEDFAETFAVWLTPESNWQRRYAGWPALAKLEYIDRLMTQLRGKKALVESDEEVDPLRKLRHTLRRYYRRKRSHHGIDHPKFYDRELRKLFSDAPEHAGNMTAAQFLGKIRREVRRVVADWTGIYQYTIDRVLEDMITRSRELKLRLAIPEEQARYEFAVLLTVQTMNFLHSGRHRVAL